MIGRVQDVVLAAVAIGAADTAKNQTSNGEEQVFFDTELPAEDVDNQVQTSDAAEPGTVQTNKDQKNETKQPKGNLDEKTVSQMTKELNKLMSKINCDLEFQYHKEVNVMSVKMIDKSTQEVIKEYPPEDMIKGMIKAKEWIGAFLDRNA